MRKLFKGLVIALAVCGTAFMGLVLLVAVWTDSGRASFSPQPVAAELAREFPMAEAPFPPEQPVKLAPASGMAASPATWFVMTLLVFGTGFTLLIVALGGMFLFIARRHRGVAGDPGEESLMRELHGRATRMEARLEALETLLLERHRDEWAARS